MRTSKVDPLRGDRGRGGPTLRTSIAVLVLLIAVTSLTVGAAALGLHGQGLRAQVGRAQAATEEACGEIQALYLNSSSGDSARLRLDLANVVLQLVLGRTPGTEGAVWSAADGIVAHAVPTDETWPGEDTAPPEPAFLAAVAQRAVDGGRLVSDRREGERAVLVYSACPIPARHAALVVSRVDAPAPRSAERWAFALASLAVLILGAGGWHILFLSRWSGSLDRIVDAMGDLPPEGRAAIAPSGHPDLDGVVRAFNSFGARLAEAQERSRGLTHELRQAERTALIGSLVASIAHEIRNPLGAIRLRVENALAGGAERYAPALQAVLTQIERLEGLLTRLLSLARPLHPEVQEVDVGVWLRDVVALRAEQARAAAVELTVEVDAGRWRLDPTLMSEAVDNLVHNALQSTPGGGRIEVTGTVADHSLRIEVVDTGPGVPPGIRARLFEPFVAARRGGTGLGLAATRDIVSQHGGSLELLDRGAGAAFAIALPWRDSSS